MILFMTINILIIIYNLGIVKYSVKTINLIEYL